MLQCKIKLSHIRGQNKIQLPFISDSCTIINQFKIATKAQNKSVQ